MTRPVSSLSGRERSRIVVERSASDDVWELRALRSERASATEALRTAVVSSAIAWVVAAILALFLVAEVFR